MRSAEPALLARLLRLAAACGLATALLFAATACDLTSGDDARDPGGDSREGGDGDDGEDGGDGDEGGDGEDGGEEDGEDGDGGDDGDDGDEDD